MNFMSQDNNYLIPILDKGMSLLELLAKNPKGLTLQEMVDIQKNPKTTIFRIARSFVDMGYMIKDEESGRFFLGRPLFRLGLASLGESNIVDLSIGPMRNLRDEIKESVMLGTIMDSSIVLLEQVLGSYNFIFMNKLGGSFCIHASAPGKVFLAYLDKDKSNSIIDDLDLIKFNNRTITTKRDLKREISKVTKVGYGVDIEEELDGIHCIAAPVFNQFGKIVASIWTSGPSGRLKLEHFEEVSSRVIACADRISSKLGYKPENQI